MSADVVVPFPVLSDTLDIFFYSDFYFKLADMIMTEHASSTAGFVFKKRVNSDKVFCESEVSSTTTSRFKPPSSTDELDKLSGKQFAQNTDQKIAWAIEMFREWRKERMVDPSCCCIYE